MNTNKQESTKKVVVSILEHTTQKSLHMLNTELIKKSENAFSYFSCLSWLQNIRGHRCLSVVPNLSVFSVVKNGGFS